MPIFSLLFAIPFWFEYLNIHEKYIFVNLLYTDGIELKPFFL